MSERNGDLLKGLIIGGLIGAALGILYAPKSGKETREDIARKTEELMNKAKEEYEKAVIKSKQAYEAAIKRLQDVEVAAKAKVEEVESKVSEFAEQSAETIQDNKNRLKKAINAGVDAYREEKTKKPA
ncbi:MAG: YtxH-like protein [Smithella sp. PtaU1.Bin162]|jgi:gas vesicle protein|nr:MAG: YtxH-like protein [Smithella sp. PtaU1.Bin162]